MFSFGLYPQKEQIYNKAPHQDLRGFSGAVISDVGRIRKNNEDNFVFEKNMNCNSIDMSQINVSYSAISNEWHVACVFDGMGGEEMGEVASSKAAEVFLYNSNNLARAQTTTEADLILRKAFLEANNQIVSLQRECKVSGTTATVLCTNCTEFKIYHLGDSRAYLAREGKLIQITKDHTLAQMKIDIGLYQKNDPMIKVDKHRLTDFLGRDRTRENIKPEESRWLTIQKGDRILLCSDGLTSMCTDDEIAKILYGTSSATAAVSLMVRTAKANGGFDNITCIAFFFL